MERLDAKELSGREVNAWIKQRLGAGVELAVDNPHSMHNLGTALIGRGTVRIKGSTGFYTGGFLEGPTLVVEANTGWYAGDNMMAGTLVVEGNAGSNLGPSMLGGTIVVKGSTGSRAGFGMKGGDLLVMGDVGRWCGQMTMGGRIVVLGSVGLGLGESMYRGLIHTRDPEAREKLGGNVEFHNISTDEAESLRELFATHGVDADPDEFKSVRPMTSGRHSYTLFSPQLTPSGKR